MTAIPPNGFYPRFYHSMFWEHKEKFDLYEDTNVNWVVFAIVSGSFYYEIADHKGYATFGDVLICPPRTTFRRVIITPLTFHAFFMRWEHVSGSEADPQQTIPVGKISIRDTHRLAGNYAELKKADQLQNPWRMLCKNHYLQDIWLMYCEELASELPTANPDDRRKIDPLMAQASSLIRQNAFQAFSLKSLASTLGISPVQLSKNFKAAYGVTPIHYLTSIRLEKAKTLLVETKLTLEQISECCGYQTGLYLNRVFIKYEHITPSQYRKMYRM